jgi:hypothetical protein
MSNSFYTKINPAEHPLKWIAVGHSYDGELRIDTRDDNGAARIEITLSTREAQILILALQNAVDLSKPD